MSKNRAPIRLDTAATVPPIVLSRAGQMCSYLDADKVDGKHASEFLHLTGGTMTGDLKTADVEFGNSVKATSLPVLSSGSVSNAPFLMLWDTTSKVIKSCPTWLVRDWLIELGGLGGSGTTAHSGLTGLGNDDHPQYVHTNKIGQSVAQFLELGGGIRLKAASPLATAATHFPVFVADPTSGNGATVQSKTLAEMRAELGTGVTDHGALTGLADDDHPRYLSLAKASQTVTQEVIFSAGLKSYNHLDIEAPSAGGSGATHFPVFTGDPAAGNKRVYSKTAAEVRAALGGTQVLFVSASVITVPANSNDETSLVPSIRAGGSKVVSLSVGDVIKIEASGTFSSDSGSPSNWSNNILRIKIGTFVWELVPIENNESVPVDFVWSATAILTVLASGTVATVSANAWLDIEYDTAAFGMSSMCWRFGPTVSGSLNYPPSTLNSTVPVTIDVTWQNIYGSTGPLNWTCKHVICTRY